MSFYQYKKRKGKLWWCNQCNRFLARDKFGARLDVPCGLWSECYECDARRQRERRARKVHIPVLAVRPPCRPVSSGRRVSEKEVWGE